MTIEQMNQDHVMRGNYKRRVLRMRDQYNMKWTRRQSMEFIDRLMRASRTEGIDDVDLRVLVRIYNREVQNHGNT